MFPTLSEILDTVTFCCCCSVVTAAVGCGGGGGVYVCV